LFDRHPTSSISRKFERSNSKQDRKIAMTLRTWLGVAALAGAVTATPCFAWGDDGHKIVAAIARERLSAETKAKVDAILATDTDTLTTPDMVARATWADKWRDHGHRETAQWHFIDIELANPDLDAACFGHPPSFQLASAGPPNSCVVDRIKALSTELAAKDTPPSERLFALKFLLHFVGDMHQPLHASDNQDRGGNCVMVRSPEEGVVNLHHYWDTTLVDALGSSPGAIATHLATEIKTDQAQAWSLGDEVQWARESNAVAVQSVYTIGSVPGCPAHPTTMALPDGYDAAARLAVALQLERAGVRLALVLERDLAPLSLGDVTATQEFDATPAKKPAAKKKHRRRSARPR
jgi:hypothetical protein